MKAICVLPIDRKNKNTIRTLYLHNSTILSKYVDSDTSLFESVKFLLQEHIKTESYHTQLFYLEHLIHEGIRHDCFFFDITEIETEILPTLKKVKIESIIQADRKHNDSLVLSLCFKAMSYLK